MKINLKTCVAATCLFLVTAICSEVIGEGRGPDARGDRGKSKRDGGIFRTGIPEYQANVILGRATHKIFSPSGNRRVIFHNRFFHLFSPV